MAAANAALVLKEDAELLAKVLQIGVGGAGGAGVVELADLTADLQAAAAADASPEVLAARWSDAGSRRSLFDRALVGRLSSSADTPVIDYLIGCHTRCADLRSRKGAGISAELGEVFSYVQELCVSYSAIALLNPTMFPQPAEAEEEGVLRLLKPLREQSLPHAFLSRLVARLDEDGTLSEFGLPLFARIAEEAKKATVLTDFSAPFHALHALVCHRPLGALLANDPSFLPKLCRNGALLQMGARLSPFLAISCFPADPQIAPQCFPDVSQPHLLEESMQSLRMSLSLVQTALGSVSKELLKNPAAKEPFFALIAACCTLNAPRAQQWFPHAEGQRLLHAIAPENIEPPQAPRGYSHDGLLVNLSAVLLALCDPFTAPGSPHVSKIDPSYMLSTHRLDLSDETRMHAHADDVAYWLNPADEALRAKFVERRRADGVEAPPPVCEPLEVSSSFGTISEYFFLTMRMLHVGLSSAFAMLERLMKEHGRWNQDLNLREAELMRLRAVGGAQHAAVAAQLEGEVGLFKKWIDGVKRYILCFQTQLADPQLLSLCVRYYRLVSRWLVATACPPPEGLPLPKTVPRLFAALPEYCMQDVADFLKNLTHLAPQVFEQMQADELHDFVTLMVTFIGAPHYVKNPYLRATFTKLLCYLVPRDEERGGSRSRTPERLAAVFHSHPLAQKHLAPAIMQFFVDIEFTGSSTGFYDKYEYRHEMTQILEYLWAQPAYQVTMVGFARDMNKFVHFVNMVINDSIYSMDEALTKLQAIRTTQAEMADEATWAAQSSRVRQQRAQQHQQDEGNAGYFMQFTNEVLHMMRYLSSDKEVALVFMLPELCPRISQMLNHFLQQLVGPKCSNLKVKDPERYNFYPKRLLLEIASTIINFAPFPEFITAIVRDERSYDAGNIRKAIRVLASGFDSRLPPEQLEALEAFATRAEEVRVEEEENEAELGDVPEEFCDPITMEIMADPVVLPSGKVCDRPTILRHLLSDPTDPFSRAKCTPEMLKDDAELKERIHEFRRSKRTGGGEAAPMEQG